jgi:hypothetical protein
MRDLVHLVWRSVWETWLTLRAPGTAAPADALLASLGAKLLATAARVALALTVIRTPSGRKYTGNNNIPTQSFEHPPCVFPQRFSIQSILWAASG